MAKPKEEFGSGFIIGPTGYIVTNRHVIDGAYNVTVTLEDNTAYRASVLAANERPDLALLKIEAEISAINRVENQTNDRRLRPDRCRHQPRKSGGPLFNLAGKVIGVNWALVAPGEKPGSAGLGLAIPANDVAFVLDHMRRCGRLRSGRLGVRVQQLYLELCTGWAFPPQMAVS